MRIIPDIHGRTFWREIQDVDDKVIFLGDYFDPYPSEDSDKEDSLFDMFHDIVEYARSHDSILLLGNHDCHYLWDNFIESTRYNHRFAREYHYLFKENLDLFKLCHIENNIIYSHAGFTPSYIKSLGKLFKIDNPTLIDVADKLSKINLNEISNELISSLSNISHYRGGFCESGSCLWADIREHFTDNLEYEIKYDVPQIFGHTRVKKPIIADTFACLDCQQIFTDEIIRHSPIEIQ